MQEAPDPTAGLLNAEGAARGMAERRAWLAQAAAWCAAALLGGTGTLRSAHAARAQTPSAEAGLSALKQGVLIAAHASADALWVSDNRGHLYVSRDEARSWARAEARGRGAVTAIHWRGRLGLAVGHRSTVMRSTDRGTRWEPVRLDAAESVSLLDALMVDDDRALACGAFGHYWQSDDAGQSWRRGKAVDGDKHLNACAMLADGTLVIVGEGGLILRSTDHGATWAAVASPTQASLFGVTATRSGRLLACGLGGTLLQSTDQGQSWAASTTSPAVTWLSATAQDGDGVLLAGHHGMLALLDARSGKLLQSLREGYGSWAALLPCGSNALIAVGETGLALLDREHWRRVGTAHADIGAPPTQRVGRAHPTKA